jgi:O-antigen/teichoic acid export membrane protein
MKESQFRPSHNLFKGTTRNFLAEALMLPTGLLTVIFLTRRLGPEGYGLFALAATLAVWFEGIVNSVLASATVKFVGEAKLWQPIGTTVMRTQLAVSILAALALALLAPAIAAWLHEPMLITYLRLFALEIPLFILVKVHQNILIGVGRYEQQSIATATRWLARLLLIVILVELGFSISGAILGSIGGVLISLFIARFFIRPSLFQQSNFPISKLWGYALPLFLSALSLQLFTKLDLFVFKHLGGTSFQAGIYAAAQNLSLLPIVFSLAFVPLLLSTLSSSLSLGDHQQFREISTQAIRIVIWQLPFAALAAGSATEIVAGFFGNEYLSAAPLLALLIFGAVAQAMFSVVSANLIASGKPKWIWALTGFMPVLAIAGHYLLIPSFGAMGAAFVTTSLSVLMAIVGILAVYGLWHIPPGAKTLLRSFLICVGVYSLAQLWPTPGIWLLLKLPVIGMLIFLSYLILGEFTKKDLVFIHSLLPR